MCVLADSSANTTSGGDGEGAVYSDAADTLRLSRAVESARGLMMRSLRPGNPSKGLTIVLPGLPGRESGADIEERRLRGRARRRASSASTF
jgi:hypothetical protein